VEAAEILLASSEPDLTQIREIVTDIRRDDQRVAEIINRVRALMKRQQDIELQDFDLNDAVRWALHLLDAEAIRRGVSLAANTASRAVWVRADPVHVQQVVNLAMNAIDATQGGRSSVQKVTVETTLLGDAEAEISVSDSGAGIPEEKLPEIFRPFFTTKPNGTGLGLSIARVIVETYGGRIWAENGLDGGAVFRFTVPLARNQPA
jgi:signal transduction histidine kinase